jgi:hypothetical protein
LKRNPQPQFNARLARGPGSILGPHSHSGFPSAIGQHTALVLFTVLAFAAHLYAAPTPTETNLYIVPGGSVNAAKVINLKARVTLWVRLGSRRAEHPVRKEASSPAMLRAHPAQTDISLPRCNCEALAPELTSFLPQAGMRICGWAAWFLRPSAIETVACVRPSHLLEGLPNASSIVNWVPTKSKFIGAISLLRYALVSFSAILKRSG